MYTYLNNGGKKGTQGEKHGITQKQILGTVRKKTLLERWVGTAQGGKLSAPWRRVKKLQESSWWGEAGLAHMFTTPNPNHCIHCGYWKSIFKTTRNSKKFVVFCPFLACIHQLLKLFKWLYMFMKKTEIPLLTIKVTNFFQKGKVWWDLAEYKQEKGGGV